MRGLSQLPIGVHYYRAPTPVPSEWKADLANIKRMGFEFIQVRPQWRWHERNEGEFQFDDLDRLFDLALKSNLKVLCKFFLPSAPQWLFDNYGAVRMTPDGRAMQPITLGAVYMGGFAPCFDKDLVREKAQWFIHATVERFREHPALVAWNAWNEPRSRPAADCACPDSMAKYRQWLAGKFGTVEDLNAFFGLAVSGKGADFSSVGPPNIYADYAGWLLFRSWRAEMIADRIGWVAREIRGLDAGHPIICHSGFASVLQDVLEDTTNDYLNAREVDLYGSSCPNRVADMAQLEGPAPIYEAATVDLLCARLRGVSSPFWINEVYCSRGPGPRPRPASYLRQTTYHTVASGAKGILYWQYRSERVSTESFGGGLTEINGEPTERSREAARIVRVLKSNEEDFAPARTPDAIVGIPYDFQSDLMSRLETTTPGMGDTPPVVRQDYPYKSALRGAHLALWELDLPVDVVPSEEYEELLRYKAVYLPCPRMVSPEQIEVLQRFVRNGGLLICEPSPAMRDGNGWVSPSIPPAPLVRLLGGREVARTLAEEERVVTTGHGRLTCPPGVFVAALEAGPHTQAANPPEVIARWDDGSPAILSHKYGRGRAVYMGVPLGEVYFRTRDRAILAWLRGVLETNGAESERLLSPYHREVRVRRLVKDDGTELLFIFNLGQKPAAPTIRRRGLSQIRELTDLGVEFQKTRGGFVAEVPAGEVLIAKLST